MFHSDLQIVWLSSCVVFWWARLPDGRSLGPGRGGCAGEWVRYLLKPAFLGAVPFLLLGTPQMIKLTEKLTSFPFFFLQALLNVFPWPLPGQEPPTKRLWFSFFTPLVWKLTWVWEGVLEFHITFLLQSQTRISARQYFSAFQKWFPPPHPFKELF